MADAGTAANAPLASGTLNAVNGSVVKAKISQGGQLYFRPETNEFLFIAPDKVTAFENECRLLDHLVGNFCTAKQAHLNTTLTFLEAQQATLSAPSPSVPGPPSSIDVAAKRTQDALAKTQQELEQSQKALAEAFKPLGKLDNTGGKIWELIPVVARTSPNMASSKDPTKSGRTAKWTYVRGNVIDKIVIKHKLEKELPKTTDNKLDVKKLREQLNKFEFDAKAKEELLKSPELKGTLANDFNAYLKTQLDNWASQVSGGRDWIAIEPAAQYLRYFAGASLEAEWSPLKGKASLRANASGEFMIGEAKIKASCYWPDQAGWVFACYGPVSGLAYPVGLMRFAAEIELTAMAGTSAIAELGIEANYTDLVKGLAGLCGTPLKNAGERQVKIGQLKADAKKSGQSAEGGGSAGLFAGVSAGGSIKGALQWNSPEEQAFVNLADIGPGIHLQAGAGAGAEFRIGFDRGKFYITASASACLGAGAKGKLELSVDVAKTLELCKYMAFAAYACGYEVAELMDAPAQAAWQYISLSAKAIEESLSALGNDAITIRNKLLDAWTSEVTSSGTAIAIDSNPRLLEYASPEAKATWLFHLTREGPMTNNLFLYANQGFTLSYLDRRKSAVIAICKKIRSKAEFVYIFDRLNSTCTEHKGMWEANYGFVERFLDEGYDPKDYDKQFDRRYRQLSDASRSTLRDIYSRLYEKPILGYPFIDNTHSLYASRAEKGDHPGYMIAGGYNYNAGNKLSMFA